MKQGKHRKLKKRGAKKDPRPKVKVSMWLLKDFHRRAISMHPEESEPNEALKKVLEDGVHYREVLNSRDGLTLITAQEKLEDLDQVLEDQKKKVRELEGLERLAGREVFSVMREHQEAYIAFDNLPKSEAKDAMWVDVLMKDWKSEVLRKDHYRMEQQLQVERTRLSDLEVRKQAATYGKSAEAERWIIPEDS